MRKAKKENEPVTMGRLWSVLEGVQENIKHYVNDRIAATERSFEAFLEMKLDEKLEEKLEEKLGQKLDEKLDEKFAENNKVLLDSLHKMLVKDRIEPLEKRVGKLEQKLA